ncbi:MAG: hypothetical protein NZL89_00070 [Leptospiraceae bacterium]|nr:hypothetical protein [Leptospiraceae bacterium]
MALRWSVSYLICVMLMLAEDGILPGAEGLDPEDRGLPFSNCDMKVKMWGAAGYIYTEFLLFSSSKPPNTAKPVAQNGRK